MALHNVSPVREQIRAEMLAALANGALMTATELYAHCPSATESTEIARIAHDMRRTGKLETGEQVIHPLGMKVNTYRLPTTEDPRIEAAKVTNAAPKIKPTRQPAIKRKPAPGHPFAAPIRPHAAHDSLPRVTRDLPINLQSAAPPVAAESVKLLIEEAMSQEPTPYIVNPQFALEPKAPEAQEDIDSDLVSALKGLAEFVPLPQADDDDDVLAMASSDVSEIAAAMGKEEPKKVCQCVRINSLPPLPEGYIYGGIKVWIEARHDVGHLAITTHDEGGGPFCSLKATGHLSFDTGDMVAIGKVADALIKLHESMGDGHE